MNNKILFLLLPFSYSSLTFSQKDESVWLKEVRSAQNDSQDKCLFQNRAYSLYINTYGYGEQFCVPSSVQFSNEVRSLGPGKKFQNPQLEETILSCSGSAMEEQKTLLQNRFSEWKGDL